jgi:bifunctional non-homologous end joining protein LigD
MTVQRAFTSVVVMSADETLADVPLTNLDQPLFDGAEATKRDLVDYLDGVRDRILPALADRPLSVIRVHRGQEAFMQKNVPKYTPEWVKTVKLWSETSKRDVFYAVCDDRRTLVWFANQRAIEYHPTLVLADRLDHATHLVLDLDPPDPDAFSMAVRAAHLVRQALTDVGLDGAVKTSGAKGLHVFVPLADGVALDDAAAVTRAIAGRVEQLDPEIATTAFMKEDRGGKVFIDSTRVGGGTVVAAYSPRVRPGVPVSFPIAWSDLDNIAPRDFTIHTALQLLGGGDPWVEHMPAPQELGADLIAEGYAIPASRVQAMHEGKRRARARRTAEG